MTKLLKVLVASSAITLAACSDPLAVDFPGRIPTETLADPSLAPVLVNSVLGDFECAYSNYAGGSSVHSDEYETANSNIPGANWGERSVTDALDDYAIGPCDDGSIFGIVLNMQTARYQSETVAGQLAAWTDEEVPGRASLQAQVRAYGAYSYLMMGETFCSVSFDGGPEEPKENALAIAATEFEEAIGFAQASGNTAMLNMARVGLARTRMNQKQWADAAAAATLVPAGFVVNATRAADNPRRWNKLYRNATEQGAYTVATVYRDLAAADPRVLVIDSGHGAFNPGIRLWVTSKYTSNASPIRIASYDEAQLILAEAQAEQGDLDGANATLNVSRTAAGLTPFPSGQTKDEVIANVIAERRAILSFEGGHRLNDLLRKGIAWKVGANPFTGRPYGSTTCWPMPIKEKQGA